VVFYFPAFSGSSIKLSHLQALSIFSAPAGIATVSIHDYFLIKQAIFKLIYPAVSDINKRWPYWKEIK